MGANSFARRPKWWQLSARVSPRATRPRAPSAIALRKLVSKTRRRTAASTGKCSSQCPTARVRGCSHPRPRDHLPEGTSLAPPVSTPRARTPLRTARAAGIAAAQQLQETRAQEEEEEGARNKSAYCIGALPLLLSSDVLCVLAPGPHCIGGTAPPTVGAWVGQDSRVFENFEPSVDGAAATYLSLPAFSFSSLFISSIQLS